MIPKQEIQGGTERMKTAKIIEKTAGFAREKLKGDSTGHDWWHVERVWKNAAFIAEKEGTDLFIVELAALLHDIADWKFHGGNKSIGPKTARKFLESLNVDSKIISHVCDIIKDISFKGAGVKSR